MLNIRNIFLYGGIDKETYQKVTPRVYEDDKKSIRTFTILGTVGFLFAAIMSVFKNVNVETYIYYAGTGLFVIMFLLNEFLSKKFPKISYTLSLIFSLIILTSGVLIAYSQYTERTTMLLPLFSLVALVFCYRPIYLVFILTSIEVIYLLLLKSVEGETLFFVNLVNTLIFYFIGMIGGFSTLIVKFKKFKAEYENSVLVEVDTLTGVYNRYSCMQEYKKIQEGKLAVSIWSFDINEMKQTNDTLGHLAGDELLKGAANCISEVFSPYGKVYRVGGDEFCALLFKEHDEEELGKKFAEVTKNWNGKLVHNLSVAYGVVNIEKDSDLDIEVSIHKADQLMYASKKAYYESKN